MIIKFGSELHARVLQEVMNRFEFSRNYMAGRHEMWEKMDQRYMAYLPEKEADRLRRNIRETTGEPQITTFDVPYSYAMLLSAHTYWSTVFLGRTPVFQYTPRRVTGDEALMGVEALMDYQMNVGGMLLPLYIWLMDVGKYGVGVIGSYWSEETCTVSAYEEVPEMYLGVIPTGKMKKTKVSKVISKYQGNRLYNVRPTDFFPDPSLPLTRFQEGEFVGRLVDTGWNAIVRKELEGEYFNLDELRKSKGAGSLRKWGTGPQENPTASAWNLAGDVESVTTKEILEMTIELIPREWKLGKGEAPEKWIFTVADGGRVIIGAEPLGRYHDHFEMFPIEYDIDGYNLHKRGMLEVLDSSQNVLTFLLNSHLTNVRKSVNNQFIVDPSKVVMKDLLDPRAGKMIRLKPGAYGTDTRTVLSQIPVQDITQNHIRDMNVIERFMQLSSGVNDSIMGQINSGGRKSATEIRTSSTFGVNRMKTNAEYFSAMGFAPLAQVLLQTTQQYYDAQESFKVAGIAGMKHSSLIVTPEMISGFYDYVPVDGTMPVDRYAQANLWTNLLGQMKAFPEVLAQYDAAGIFGVIAQLSGIKSINQFKLNSMSDAKIDEQLRAGQTVPVQEALNAARPAAPVDTRFDATRVPEPGQLPGMGATG